MQDSRELDYFGQRILQIIQPLAAGTDRAEVLTKLAASVANNFAADGCWVLHYPSPGVVRVAASACTSHRTNAISLDLPNYPPPSAPTPTVWKMPLLADYRVMVVELHDRQQINGCLMVATKGVEWYRETKLVLQIVADYISTALVTEELDFQVNIARIYPALHHHLTQAIVENQQIDRLFEIAVSDMVTALQLQRGLVLTLKSTESKHQRSTVRSEASDKQAPLTTTADLDNLTPAQPQAIEQSTTVAESTPTARSQIVAAKAAIQVQIVTTIDARDGTPPVLPSSFFLENSHFCQQALANAPQPTIFDYSNRATQVDRLVFQDEHLPSIAMIPLMGAETPDRHPIAAVWGWLVLQHNDTRRWHPVELKLLQCQIYQIALARIHKQALKQSRNATANRTSQVQTSLQIQAKLHDAGRKRMEKLRQANQLKDEFINTVSHELRTPLTSMSLAIKMLRQPDVDPDRRQQYLDILDEQCQREIKLVNDLLKLQQLESQQLEFRPQRISVNQFISEQATIVSDRWLESRNLELALHLPQVSPQIETDADSLQHILEELLVNAGKFALPNTTIEVWVSVEGEQVTFGFNNFSKLIPSQDLPNLFEKFRRGSGTTQQAIAGTGLGLALVKSLLEHIQGTIEATSNPIDGAIAKTSFTVIIPTVLEHH